MRNNKKSPTKTVVNHSLDLLKGTLLFRFFGLAFNLEDSLATDLLDFPATV